MIFFFYSALNKVSAATETDNVQHTSHEFRAKCEKGKNVGQNNLSRSLDSWVLLELTICHNFSWCFCSCKVSRVSLKMGGGDQDQDQDQEHPGVNTGAAEMRGCAHHDCLLVLLDSNRVKLVYISPVEQF